MSLAFDTLETSKELKASGFTDVQAEAVTRALRASRDFDFASLATKADLAQFVTKAELAAGLAETKADILKWMICAMAFQTLAILGGAVALLRLAPG